MSAARSLEPPRRQILVGDALTHIRGLPTASIDMVLTSPPYFRLRDYGHQGQLGLEGSVDDWADQLAAVMREVRRVLVPTGTVWLNLGDTYSTHSSQGAARKSLLLAPSRVALKLQRDGWLIRNAVVWAKPNPMPTSVRDRLAATHETVYLLTAQPRYFFNLDAIRLPHRSAVTQPRARSERPREAWRGPNSDSASGLAALKAEGLVGHPLGKNPGDVWTIAPGGFRGAHHAVFPPLLAERAIQAGCPEARCRRCRAPWRRRLIRALGAAATRGALSATCGCRAPSEPGLVLDSFLGSGTTAVVAERLDRDWLGVELQPHFAALARARIAAEAERRQKRPAPSERAA